MRNKISKLFFLSILILLVLAMPEWAEAQCRMCAAGAEANLKNGGTEGAGLNTGILYLLSMPYLIAFSIGGMWWWNRRKAQMAHEDELIQELLS